MPLSAEGEMTDEAITSKQTRATCFSRKAGEYDADKYLNKKKNEQRMKTKRSTKITRAIKVDIMVRKSNAHCKEKLELPHDSCLHTSHGAVTHFMS